MQVHTIVDITPGGAATALSAVKGTLATWVALSAAKGNAGAIRFGDSNVSATRGAALAAGATAPFLLPRCDFNQGQYDLSQIYVFGTSTDSVSVTYGQ